VVDSIDELVKRSDVDVVYIATPHHRHHDNCVTCLSGDKAVLCEKPFMLNACQARSAIELARERQVFCMEAMWMRFHPLLLKARALVESGAIGQPRLLLGELGYPTPFRADNRFFNPALGGGALLDRGVYLISLAFFLLGRPTEANSRATIGPSGVDEQTSIVLTYRNGALVVATASLRSRLSNCATLIGTDGQICIQDPFYAPHHISLVRSKEPVESTAARPRSTPYGLRARTRRSPLVRRVFDQIGRPVLALLRRSNTKFVHYARGTGYQYEAAEVARCIRAGCLESPLMPLDETIAISETMDVLRNSWRIVE
jgi:predicted dehydrogenase